MPHRSKLRRALACLLVLLPAASAWAYNFDGVDQEPVSWPAGEPVVYRINDNVSDSLGNVVDGSDPVAAIVAGFEAWDAESGIGFQRGADTGVRSTGFPDGINLITFEDTTVNRIAVGDFLALTAKWTSNGEIVDTDIVFNPDFTFTTLNGGGWPIRPLVTHEIGHVHGLEHSSLTGAAMWPYLAANGVATEGENLPSRPTHDDKLGARALYGGGGIPVPATTLTGVVRLDGSPVYGAHVVAVDADNGIVVGNLTLGDNQGANHGVYRIEGLTPGQYYVYAEPVNGRVDDGNFTGQYGSGDYFGGTFTTGYRTTWFGGNDSPDLVTVNEGVTTMVSIDLIAGNPTIVPERAGFSANGTTAPSLIGLPLRIEPGTARHVAIGGNGISSVPNGGIRCSDPGIAIDTSARVDGSQSGDPYSIFRVTVPAGAEGGARDLIFANGGQVETYTGGLYVDAPETEPTPTPTPTVTPTPTPTPTPTVTPTPTPTPTVTPTPTPTPDPTDTTPPAAPTGLIATPTTSTVVLNWDDNTEPDLVGYAIQRALAESGPFGLLDVSQVSMFVDSDVTSGTTYYYNVVAFDGIPNFSAASETVSATPRSKTQAQWAPYE